MPKAVPVLRFGPFEADGRTGELRNNGIPVKLAPQAFQILMLLAEHPGDLVTREQIQLTLWPHGTVVNWEHSINTAIKSIRNALRDSRAEPRYLETLSRRGYRFVAAVERVEMVERQPAPVFPKPVNDDVETSLVADEPSNASWDWDNPEARIISHYRVVREIGRGGMGVVYEAEDTRLGRRLALKFLAPDFESDPQAVTRFEREARMACVLSHPNICTIFEVGKAAQTPFLAMELLEGQTLQQLIAAATNGSPLSTSAVLDVGIAVADALEGAHSSGVIHRDIKPSNIFLTRTSGVKVLDFGLAKPASRPGDNRNLDPADVTSAGVAVGTFAYMSPEQRRAEEVDGRSDLYSLGCVLYEAATGRSFDFRSVQSLIGAEFAAQHPRRLFEIIARLIDPDPDLRYQTAGDLASDLRRLRRDLSSAQNAQLAPASPTSRPRWNGVRIGIVIAGCLAVLVGSWYVLRGRNSPSGPFSIQPLTGLSEHEDSPAFSPDGKLVAYSGYSEGQTSHIYIKMIGGGPPLALTGGPEADFSPAWSPDARSVAFVRRGSNSRLCIVPALGGVAREIASANPLTFDAGSRAISWLPNSIDLLSSDRTSSDVPADILEISSKTGAKRQLTHPARDILGDGSPEVSPDGRQFAFLRWVRNSVSEIYVQALDGADARRLTFDGSRISSLAWMPDGRGIVFQSRRGALPGLWKISTSGGQPQPLTGVGGDAALVAIARTGHLLAYVYQIQNVDLWKTAVPSASRMGTPAMLTPSPREDVSGEYSPDGQRIVFSSDRSGAFEIWTCAADGTAPQQVTYFKGPITGTPHWSPDGRWILFDSRPSGRGSVFVIGRDGGQAREITKDPVDDIVPNWSRDGEWIYFSSTRGNGNQLYRIPAAGGSPVQVTRNGGFEAVESPDRKWLYYTKEANANGIWRMSLAGGDEHLVLKRFVARFWTVTSSGLAYLDIFAKPRPLLSMIDLETGRTTTLAPLKGRIVWGSSGFSLSPDGHWLLFPQVDRTVSEINVVENFQ